MKFISRSRAAIGRMQIRPQLYIAFGLVLMLTAAVGAIALSGLSRVDKQVHTMSDKWLRGVGLLAEMRTALVETREFEVKHGRISDGSYHAEYEEKMTAATKIVSATLASYEPLAKTDAEHAVLEKFGKGWAVYQQSARRVVSLGREKKQQDAADISDGAASMAFDETLVALNTMTKSDFAGGQAAAAVTSQIYASARLWVIGLMSGALAAGLALAWLITRDLLRQLGGEPRTASALARSVAEGDLTTRIVLRKGDSDSLMAQLQLMQGNLSATVTGVRFGSENVATASAQIAQGNQDLSNRTEQQASALQETASTMDQLGAAVRNNADSARQASQLAQGASGVAVKGGNVVNQVVETMKGINDSSKRIADIISVIDSIAFQTNILALNAAVEAARAGEQGRGFAVVASEVRSLAQRSAGAAKEIKGLINASVQRVADGTALVDQAGQTMDEIVTAIKRVTDIVAEISASSTEQSSGVSQVGEAIAQMDRATQQNAALVQESAAAADSMSQQAQQLVAAVAVFKLQAA